MTTIGTKVPDAVADITGRQAQESAVSSRIKGPDGSTVSGGSRAVERVRAAAPASSATKPQDADSQGVHITDAARGMLALQQAIGELPDIDNARVEGLRSAIEHQQYQVDAGKIADRLLQLEGDLAAAGTTAGNKPG
jgi:negative regulator of flagellin synthesis FlgM